MLLELTLNEANERLCDIYERNLQETIPDLMHGAVPIDHFQTFYGYRQRIESMEQLSNYAYRMKAFFDVCLEYISVFEIELLNMGFYEVRIIFPGVDSNSHFGTKLNATGGR